MKITQDKVFRNFPIMMVFLIGLVFVLAFLDSCSYVKEPKLLEGETKVCYYARYCDFTNQKNPDKSKCVRRGSSCISIEVTEYCLDREIVLKAREMNFQSCLNRHDK